MARSYGSFLIRYWALDGAESRIEIKHIQSGDHTQVTSLAACLSWMGARIGPVVRANPADAKDAGGGGEEVTAGDGATT